MATVTSSASSRLPRFFGWCQRSVAGPSGRFGRLSDIRHAKKGEQTVSAQIPCHYCIYFHLFHVHTLAAGPERRLCLLAPERVDIPGDKTRVERQISAAS
jgi:hypothetical protein